MGPAVGGVLRNLHDLDFRQELRWLIEAGLQSALQRPVSVSLTQELGPSLTAPARGEPDRFRFPQPSADVLWTVTALAPRF